MGIIKNFILFVIALSSIVIVHEGGHLIAAKFFNVYCSEFSIGMGPKIFSKKFKETELSVRALPLGGFVSMAGDNENKLETTTSTDNIPFERTLPGIAPVKRIVIMLAGIIMNFILATFIISIILLNTGVYGVAGDARISEVMQGYPAETSGLKVGDLIKYVCLENGSDYKVKDYEDLTTFLATNTNGQNIYFEIDRDGEKLNFIVSPVFNEEYNSYMVGIGFFGYEYVEINPFNCLYYSCNYLIRITRLTLNALIELLFGIGVDNLSGPVGIYSAVSEASSYGASYYFILIAMLSHNIGLMNALPLPVMDGGRVVLTIYEMITNKSVDKKIETILMSGSVILLLMLMALVTFKDVLKLF